MWTRRAYRNLAPLNVVDLRFKRRWAVLGWLIPGVNLVVPKQILDDTWRASDPAMPPYASGGSGWRRTPVPTGHFLWWICTLVGLPVVVLTELQLSLAGTLPPTTTAGIHDARMGYLLLAGSQALLVFAAILLIRLLGAIYERQRDRADAIGPVAPVPAHPGAGQVPTADVPPSEPVEAESVFVHALDAQAIGRY